MVAFSILRPIIQPLDAGRFRNKLLDIEKEHGVDSYLSGIYYKPLNHGLRGFVAIVREEPVGYVLYKSLNRAIVVRAVTVVRRHRLRSVGKQLVWKVMGDVLNPSFPILRMLVRQSNAGACDFCMAIGLQLCDQHGQFFPDGETAEVFEYHLPAQPAFTFPSRFSLGYRS